MNCPRDWIAATSGSPSRRDDNLGEGPQRRHPRQAVDDPIAAEAADYRRTGLSYLPFEDNAAHLFFQPMSRRYEKGSILITSNRSVGEWGSVFWGPGRRHGDTGPPPSPLGGDHHKGTATGLALERTKLHTDEGGQFLFSLDKTRVGDAREIVII